MKFWFLALITIAGCAGLLAWVVQRRVIPAFVSNTNGEMVADWHGALVDFYKDAKTWPGITDPKLFAEQIFTVVGADGNRISAGYLHGREYNYDWATGQALDIYQRPLKVTFSGASCEVQSAGADGVWGNADDVSSKEVREHAIGETLAEARALSAVRAARKK